MTKQKSIMKNPGRRLLALDCAPFLKEHLSEFGGNVDLWDVQRMEAFACDEAQALKKEAYDYLILGDFLERYPSLSLYFVVFAEGSRTAAE